MSTDTASGTSRGSPDKKPRTLETSSAHFCEIKQYEHTAVQFLLH